ncbi:11472_t:CDS:2, partial [Cetraspora pellucida]
NNNERFSKTTVTENSDSKYSSSEYNDSEFLIYELENSNEKIFDNKKTKLNKEEAKQLIYKNNTQQYKNKKLQEVAQKSISLNQKK